MDGKVRCCSTSELPDMAEFNGLSSGSDLSVFIASDSDALEKLILEASNFQMVFFNLSITGNSGGLITRLSKIIIRVTMPILVLFPRNYAEKHLREHNCLILSKKVLNH